MRRLCVIVLLTVLPLNGAQALLLFNANFWRVIQRGMRISDFLDSLLGQGMLETTIEAVADFFARVTSRLNPCRRHHQQ